MAWKKGQIWSYDILAAIVVFIITFAFLAFFWWSVSITTGEPRAEALSREAKGLSDSLLSPGTPQNWHALVNPGDTGTWASVSGLGLTEGFGEAVISEQKAGKIVLMGEEDYALLKQKLRTNYNFYVEVKEFYNCSHPSIQNSPMNCTGRGIPADDPEWDSMEHFALANGANFSFGLLPEGMDARSVSAMNRYALYKDSLVRMKVVLWTNQSWQ